MRAQLCQLPAEFCGALAPDMLGTGTAKSLAQLTRPARARLAGLVVRGLWRGGRPGCRAWTFAAWPPLLPLPAQAHSRLGPCPRATPTLAQRAASHGVVAVMTGGAALVTAGRTSSRLALLVPAGARRRLLEARQGLGVAAPTENRVGWLGATLARGS